MDIFDWIFSFIYCKYVPSTRVMFSSFSRRILFTPSFLFCYLFVSPPSTWLCSSSLITRIFTLKWEYFTFASESTSYVINTTTSRLRHSSLLSRRDLKNLHVYDRLNRGLRSCSHGLADRSRCKQSSLWQNTNSYLVLSTDISVYRSPVYVRWTWMKREATKQNERRCVLFYFFVHPSSPFRINALIITSFAENLIGRNLMKLWWA